MFSWLIFGLSVWRISSLLVNEDGPWDIFRHIREWVGIKDLGAEGVFIPNGFWPGFFSCIWCASLWISLIVLGAWLMWPSVTWWACVAFSLSSIAIWFENQVNHRH